MANLSTLIGSGSSGGGSSPFNYDAKTMIPFWAYYMRVKQTSSSVLISNGLSFWTDRMAHFGAVGFITAADTWVTICDVTGGGFLLNAIAPRPASGSAIETIEITVDDVVTTFSFNTTGAYRLCVGSFSDYITTSSSSSSDYSRYPSSTGDVDGLRYLNNVYVKDPHYLAMEGVPMIRFDQSMSIRMKCSVYQTTNYSHYCGASYFLDKGVQS